MDSTVLIRSSVKTNNEKDDSNRVVFFYRLFFLTVTLQKFVQVIRWALPKHFVFLLGKGHVDIVKGGHARKVYPKALAVFAFLVQLVGFDFVELSLHISVLLAVVQDEKQALFCLIHPEAIAQVNGLIFLKIGQNTVQEELLQGFLFLVFSVVSSSSSTERG